MERALTRFMAKTGETQSLFKDDVSTFPCESRPWEPVLLLEIITPSFLSLVWWGERSKPPCLSLVQFILQTSGSFPQVRRAYSELMTPNSKAAQGSEFRLPHWWLSPPGRQSPVEWWSKWVEGHWRLQPVACQCPFLGHSSFRLSCPSHWAQVMQR